MPLGPPALPTIVLSIRPLPVISIRPPLLSSRISGAGRCTRVPEGPASGTPSIVPVAPDTSMSASFSSRMSPARMLTVPPSRTSPTRRPLLLSMRISGTPRASSSAPASRTTVAPLSPMRPAGASRRPPTVSTPCSPPAFSDRLPPVSVRTLAPRAMRTGPFSVPSDSAAGLRAARSSGRSMPRGAASARLRPLGRSRQAKLFRSMLVACCDTTTPSGTTMPLPSPRTETVTLPNPRSPKSVGGSITTEEAEVAPASSGGETGGTPPICTAEAVWIDRLPAEPAAWARMFSAFRSRSGVTPASEMDPALPTRSVGRPCLPGSARPPPDTSSTASLWATIFPAITVIAPPSSAQAPRSAPSRQVLIHWPLASSRPCSPSSTFP
ncbi:hypothetical protein D3C85_724650 [compost metagenome]